MSGEIPESSDPVGNYSGMDQYASAYLCMDEPAVRQWYHQPFAWITGDFPGDNDVYRLFRSVGLVCNFMPFMIIPIHTSLSKMDKSFIEAAYDLGANKFQTFTKVIWKLSIPGVLNGIMMVFLLSISTFVIPKLLGGGQYMLIGNLIESQFISVGDWNFGSAISLILAVLILIFMSLMKKMDKDE